MNEEATKQTKQGVRDLNGPVNGKKNGEVIIQHACDFSVIVTCASCEYGAGDRCGCYRKCSICQKGVQA